MSWSLLKSGSVCLSHQDTICCTKHLTVQQNVSHHVHVTCLWPNIFMSAGGGDAYRWQGWQAREAQRLNICTCDTRFVQQNNIFDRKSWKKVSSHVCDDKETRPNETSGHIRLFLWLRDLTRAMFRKTVPGVFDETSGHLLVCLWQENPVLLNETSRHIRPCVRQQNQLILTRSPDISNLVCGNKTEGF